VDNKGYSGLIWPFLGLLGLGRGIYVVICDNGEQIDPAMAVAAACELPIELGITGLFALDEVFRLTSADFFLYSINRVHDVSRTLIVTHSHTYSLRP